MHLGWHQQGLLISADSAEQLLQVRQAGINGNQSADGGGGVQDGHGVCGTCGGGIRRNGAETVACGHQIKLKEDREGLNRWDLNGLAGRPAALATVAATQLRRVHWWPAGSPARAR